jgi:hypothetical protein
VEARDDELLAHRPDTRGRSSSPALFATLRTVLPGLPKTACDRLLQD